MPGFWLLACAALLVPALDGPSRGQTVAPPAPVQSAPLEPPAAALPPAASSPATSPSAGGPPASVSPPVAGVPIGPVPANPPAQSPAQGVGSAPVPPAPTSATPPPAPPALAQPGGAAQGVPRDFAAEPDLIELAIEARPVLVLAAEASNDDGFAALLAALARLNEEARKAGIVVTGRPFAVVDLTDEKLFKFQAMLPVENTAATPPIPGLRFGQSPAGQAIRFKYTGAYEDNTYVYESIEAYIEERGIQARPYAIEEFLTDPKDSADASLQMFIYYLRE